MGERAAGRIAVVGAGIVGCSCALFLQRDGHEVVLVDPRDPGAGTSSGNAGVISLYGFAPLSTPELWRRLPRLLCDPVSPLAIRWTHLPTLLPWLARFALNSRAARMAAISQALGALLDRAAQAHDIVIQQCGLADLVRRGGWLKVAFARALLDAYVAADRPFYEQHGREYQVLDRAAILDLEPALSPEIGGGLLLTENRAVRQPQRYVEAIARTVIERGGRFFRGRAEGIAAEGQEVLAVLTDHGPIEADGVVIAAGAFSRGLSKEAGAPVPLIAERGYHLMLPQPEPSLQRPVYTIEGGFVMAPMEHGLRLTGGVELASNEAPPDYRRIRGLLPLACRLVPGLRPEVVSEWQGHRPSLPDSLPVIDRAPNWRNLWLAFGHQHVGLTLGPLTGRLIADLVAGRDPGLDLAPYSATRAFA